MLALAVVGAVLSIQGAQDLPRLEVGKSIEGWIEDADPVVGTETLRNPDFTDAPVRGRRYAVEISEPGSYTLELHSYFFDAYLVLRDGSGTVLAEDDDGLLGTHSRIVFESKPETKSFRVDACALHGGRGRYDLTLRHGIPEELSARERARAGLEDARAGLRVVEAEKGPEHSNTAWSLNNLTEQLQANGLYREALPLCKRALAIRERVLGPKHRDTATSLNNLGMLLWVMGSPSESRPILERALAIREAECGPDHPATALSLDNLAELLRAMGSYSEARPLQERALAIREKARGPEHAETAVSLNDLGELLQDMGIYSEALPLLEHALRIHERVFGPVHPATALSLNNVGLLLKAMGRYSEARPPLERALAIWEKTLGPEDANTGMSLNNLALLLQAMGSRSEARPLLERALAISEKALSPEHPHTLASLDNLARLLQDMGNYSEARPLLERALAISEKGLGPEHPITVLSLNNLAGLHADLGEGKLAWEFACTAFDRTIRNIRATFPTLTEGERVSLCATVFPLMESKLAQDPRSPDINTLRSTYGSVLTWKGQVARTALEDRARALHSLSPEKRAKVDLLRSAQAEISAELSIAVKGDRAAHEKRLAELRDRRSSLELEMLGASGFLSQTEPSAVDLIAKLPTDSVLVDFIVHRNYAPAVIEDGKTKTVGHWTDPHVTVWIARGGSETIDRIDLGEAQPLREAIQGLLSVLEGERGVAAASGEGGDVVKKANDRVRDLLWKPIASRFGSATRIFISPDRFLCTFPFEALVDEDGRYLLEKLSICYASDGTTLGSILASTPGLVDRQGRSLLAIGGIDYDARGKTEVAKAKDELIEASSARGSFQDYWEPLRFTRKEAETIFALHEAGKKRAQGSEAVAGDDGSRMILGSDATEEVLKREVSGKGYIHIATHGFFQPEGLPSMWENARAKAEKAGPTMSVETERITGLLPGLLSGLVCAGANLPVEKGRDDGLLTAEEVTWLDLTRCDLLVLSACQTALGKDRAGEGMMSLQRAFQMAGAKSVISSLWNVDDERTVELMRSFYKHLWIDGQSRIDALRNAQLEMLAKNRVEHQGRGLPWTWGAFVLYGDWR